MLLLLACADPFPCAEDELLDAKGACHPGGEAPGDTAADDTGEEEDTGDTADSDDTEDSGDTQDSDDTGDSDDTAPPAEDGWPARFVAPYVDATAYPTVKIGEIPAENGIYRYTLGFVVAASPTSCDATWGTYYDLETGPSAWDGGAEYFLYDQLATLRAAGGDVMVSLGGAANTPVEAACGSVEATTAEYVRVVEALDLTRIDFDVEGAWLADDEATARRNAALVALQAWAEAEGRPLHVWFTLPTLPDGLTADGLEVVRSAVEAGVDVAGVNVMTMDYGDGAAPDPEGQMGEYGIQALESLHAQLADVWPDLTDDERWARVGTTPMIGLNDVITEVFEVADAEETRAFAEEVGVGMIGYWSVNRDHPCAAEVEWAQSTCNGFVDVGDWAYADVFAGYGE